MRALGVTTLERVEALPGVPPLAEVGIPGYNTASWHSISTGAGVPKGIVEKLAAEIRAVMSEPEVQKLLAAEGAIPQVSPPPEEFKRFVDSEIVAGANWCRRPGFCTASSLGFAIAYGPHAEEHREAMRLEA